MSDFLAKRNLTHFVTSLNPHLALKVLDFHIKNRKETDDLTLLNMKLKILTKSTKMYDAAFETYKILHPNTKDLPEEIYNFKTQVVKEIEHFNIKSKDARDFFTNEVVQSIVIDEKLSTSEILDSISKKDGFSFDLINKLHELANFSFSLGYDYNTVNIYLTFLVSCVGEESKLHESVLWGKVISSILIENWNDAFSSLSFLNEVLFKKTNLQSKFLSNTIKQLLHTSVIVHFGNPNFIDSLLSTYLSDQKLSFLLISTSQNLLKYFIAGSIIDIKSFFKYQKDLISLVQQIKDSYFGPFINLIDNFLIKCDIESTYKSIKLCLEDVKNDYVLHKYYEAFKLNLVTLFSITLCKLYRSFSLSEVTNEFNIEQKILENCIKELIEDKKFFGSIEEGVLTMNLASGRMKSLVEKSEELLCKCNDLLDII